MYEIIIDLGKPYSIDVETLEEVEERLRDLYEQHIKGKENELPHVDVRVYDEAGRDISETQAITEMIENIIEEPNPSKTVPAYAAVRSEEVKYD